MYFPLGDKLKGDFFFNKKRKRKKEKGEDELNIMETWTLYFINKLHTHIKILKQVVFFSFFFFPSYYCFLYKMANYSEEEPLLRRHEPLTAWTSFKVTMTSSYVNLFLIFVPIAIIFSTLIHASDTTVFTLNFIAIIPLAKLLGFGKLKR